MESAHVGIIIDSSVLIAAERRSQTVLQILEQIRAAQGEIDLGLSVVTVAELVHGAYRSREETRQRQRLAFIDELCQDVPVHPVTLEIAREAGRIDAEEEAAGIRLPFQDLLIGATALHFGYAVATLNIRHFRLIPDLPVVQI